MAAPYQLPDLIVTQLATVAWPVRHVADLGAALEDVQVAPAVLVIPYGLNVVDDGDATSVRETVLVCAVTRAANQRSGKDTRVQAGSVLSAVAALLKDWQPTAGHTILAMTTPPQPQFVDGVALYPLQYTSSYSLT